MATELTNGTAISCGRCNGIGVIDSLVNQPDECPNCGGSGRLWLYPRGAIARYYGGPLISGPAGRLALSERKEAANG